MRVSNAAARTLRSRSTTILACVAVGAVAVAGTQAWAAGSSHPTYTGCLKTTTGAIYNVKQGAKPLAACSGTDATLKLSSGDITSVAAGTGLAGGATGGDAALSLAPGYQLPQNCSQGALPVLDQSGAWTCGGGNTLPFSDQSIASLSSVEEFLGTADIKFTCNAIHQEGELAIESASTSSSFNMFYVPLNSSTAGDTGFNPPDGVPIQAAANGGSTGTFVYSTPDGEVVTGTVTWFYDAGPQTCQFHGVMQYSHT
jgi:hypothetical protein